MIRYGLWFWVLVLPITWLQCAAPRPSEMGSKAGVVIVGATSAEALDQLGPVWYYQYNFEGNPLPGHQRVYLIRPYFLEQRLVQALQAHRGAWWLVGNEPNDPNQDNLSPGAYAGFYHRFVEIARRYDPSCRIAPAGIANADPHWAQAFREGYRMQYGQYPQVDGWNIHNYLLEPEVDQLDLAEFQRRIIAFREWMNQVGEGSKPLFLTEFGALYGNGRLNRPDEDPQRVERYIAEVVQWLDTTDYVQHWAWFANYTSGEFNGDLYDENGHLTRYGQAYQLALQRLSEE